MASSSFLIFQHQLYRSLEITYGSFFRPHMGFWIELAYNWRTWAGVQLAYSTFQGKVLSAFPYYKIVKESIEKRQNLYERTISRFFNATTRMRLFCLRGKRSAGRLRPWLRKSRIYARGSLHQILQRGPSWALSAVLSPWRRSGIY